jgi:hypothetical protein
MKTCNAVISSQGGFIRSAVIIAITAFLIYAGFQFAIPYYKYSAFKSEVKEIARLDLGEKRARTQIFEIAQNLKIPINENDISVTKKASTVRVETGWSEDVDILGMYEKTLHFTVVVEE